MLEMHVNLKIKIYIEDYQWLKHECIQKVLKTFDKKNAPKILFPNFNVNILKINIKNVKIVKK